MLQWYITVCDTAAHLQQDVFQLDVSVSDALLVAVIHSNHDLLEEPPAAAAAAVDDDEHTMCWGHHQLGTLNVER
jgi:hypothetical protein